MKKEEMTIEKIQLFEKLTGQLDGLHSEIGLMAKKAQNDAINAFKLKFVNNVLTQWNSLLGEKYRPFPDFTQFSSEDLPTNSDVTLILAQYIEAAETMRACNIESPRFGTWVWQKHGIKTYPPKKLTAR